MSTLTQSQRDVVDRIAMVADDVEARMMLGTIGLYSGNEQFGILDGDDVYLRASEEHQQAFERKGAEPYNSSGGVAQASYFRVPSAIFNDDDALATWVSYAVEEAS